MFLSRKRLQSHSIGYFGTLEVAKELVGELVLAGPGGVPEDLDVGELVGLRSAFNDSTVR